MSESRPCLFAPKIFVHPFCGTTRLQDSSENHDTDEISRYRLASITAWGHSLWCPFGSGASLCDEWPATYGKKGEL